uniref:phospholipid-hydroperoxide glutathione peroxidase n=1 Tax=Pyxicephalus adspersus TaxID=30357 RepID=A0AAV3AW13_PYXAD|nr:TPA: hypothetical protein GDO54_008783 [Pyxicephalus adspersus]
MTEVGLLSDFSRIPHWAPAKSVVKIKEELNSSHQKQKKKHLQSRRAIDWSEGKTPVNYTQLVELHAKYAEKGLHILGFPCNQFGKQEPGDEAQIKDFAASYNVKFDMFSKIEVNGEGAHPLWKWMKEQPKGRGTLGNIFLLLILFVFFVLFFFQFLIDREGIVVKRFSPMDDPVVSSCDMKCTVEHLLTRY